MTDVDWVERVGSAMKRLDKEFVKDELAYLALTSKVEKPIVDRLAFGLHRDYGDNCVAVAREFTVRREIQRVDLAVTVEGMPQFLLEAKAMHGLYDNLTRRRNPYPELVGKDVKKLERYKPKTKLSLIAKVALLLITHVSNLPEDKWNRIVKYSGRMRNHRIKGINELKKKLNEHFPKTCFPVAASGEIKGGRAFDIDVTIHFRLFGPY